MKVFLSYRREDAAGIAGRLYDHLGRVLGHSNLFYDVDSIPRGVNFKAYLEQQVASCDVLLALIGKRWAVRENGEFLLLKSTDFPRLELESAIIRRVPCLPVLLDGAEMPPLEALPESLRDFVYINAAEIRSGRDFELHVDRLVKDIRSLVDHTTKQREDELRVRKREIEEEARKRRETENKAAEERALERKLTKPPLPPASLPDTAGPARQSATGPNTVVRTPWSKRRIAFAIAGVAILSGFGWAMGHRSERDRAKSAVSSPAPAVSSAPPTGQGAAKAEPVVMASSTTPASIPTVPPVGDEASGDATGPSAEDRPHAALRSIPAKLTANEAIAMIKEKNLFDGRWNPHGKFSNKFVKCECAGTEVVYDAASGLVWGLPVMPQMSISEAHAKIKDLNRERVAGLSTWRLPTLEELSTLLPPRSQDGQRCAPPSGDAVPPGGFDRLCLDPMFGFRPEDTQNSETGPFFWTADVRPGIGNWGVMFMSNDPQHYGGWAKVGLFPVASASGGVSNGRCPCR